MKTTPYELYQFLLNIPDSDVEQLLLKTTFLSLDEIEKVMFEHNED